MKKRWKKLAALLLSCLLLIPMLAACGGNGNSSNPGGASGNPEDRTLRMRQTAALVSTDWQNSTLVNDMQILWVQVFEGLYGMDEAHGGYYDLLAKDIQVSEDGLTYTVTIVDATFQNGDPLTAEDVVFSYESAMQNSRFNYVTSFINKVEAKDDKTVLFHLDYPTPLSPTHSGPSRFSASGSMRKSSARASSSGPSPTPAGPARIF